MQFMSEGVKRHDRKESGDARRERWREHRAARRTEFVDAALRAAAKYGPDLAMEHVAAEARVTKPVLYRHFTDKADLFVALGQRGTHILFERLLPAIAHDEAPVPRIRKSLDAFFSVIEDHPNLYRLLARRSIGDRQVDSDPVREDKEIIANTLSTLLGDYLRSFGMDSGGALPWAHAVVGMVQNTGEWWLESRTMSRDAVVEYLTSIIWAAIDGLLRQNGVALDPNRPIENSKIIRMPTGPADMPNSTGA